MAENLEVFPVPEANRHLEECRCPAAYREVIPLEGFRFLEENRPAEGSECPEWIRSEESRCREVSQCWAAYQSAAGLQGRTSVEFQDQKKWEEFRQPAGLGLERSALEERE
jgi:hypothetical protein